MLDKHIELVKQNKVIISKGILHDWHAEIDSELETLSFDFNFELSNDFSQEEIKYIDFYNEYIQYEDSGQFIILADSDFED